MSDTESTSKAASLLRADPAATIIRMPELEAITGLKRPTIYKRLKDDPAFPRPVPLSDSKSQGAPVGWILSEVQAWARQRAASRTERSPEMKKTAITAAPLRDLIAAHALQGLLANAHLSRSIMKEHRAERPEGAQLQAWHAEAAYQFADAMLAEREKAIGT